MASKKKASPATHPIIGVIDASDPLHRAISKMSPEKMREWFKLGYERDQQRKTSLAKPPSNPESDAPAAKE